MVGSKTPVPLFNVGDQTPPGSGLPPNSVNRSKAVAFVHIEIEELTPELDEGTIVTSTIEDAAMLQGAGLTTV